jgi:hypothetical protein
MSRPRVPGETAAFADGDHALEHQREEALLFIGDVAHGDGAGDVGGAGGVLTARIDEQHLAGIDAAVGLGVDPVVDDRGIGAAAGDRVEGQRLGAASAWLRRSTRRPPQAVWPRDLIDLPGVLVVEPGQEPYHGRTILAVYRGAGGDLRRVLDRAGQAGGIGRIENGAAGCSISNGIAWEATAGSTMIRRRICPAAFSASSKCDGGLEIGKLSEIGFRLDAGLALVDEQQRPALAP